MDNLDIEMSNESLKAGRNLRNEGGMSTVEIILILVVLIALVIIFRNQITTLVNNIFTSINSSAADVYR